MLRVYAADSPVPPAEAWSLLAEPRRWAEWAPQVEAGRLGAARLVGVVPVPARITAVTPGREWTWRVGPLKLIHAVHPTPVGSRVSTTLDGPAPIVLAYGPVVALLMRRLASVATVRR